MGPASTSAAKVVPIAVGGWTEDAIAAGLRRRELAAGAALYERVHERVNGIVWRMLGADPDHDDIVHQVFLTALDRIDTLRTPSSLESWIVGITLNTVRYELRRRRLRRLFRPADSEPIDERADRDPERQMVSRRFYAALATLRADDRIAFTLRFVEGHSLAETAELLGRSLATVKRRIERARRAFLKRARQDPVLGERIGEGDDAR